MRYIDTKDLYSKADTWGGKELWKNNKLKQDFREYFHGKCWYTECLLAGHDVDIDHFRPKKEIVQFLDYPYSKAIAATGYDWLKNDYTNYRACCRIANRKTGKGGKSNYFPVKHGSPLAQAGNLNGEIAMLLDPLVQADVNLLSFLNNSIGCTSTNHYDQSRVEVSKIIYNLVDSGLTAERVRKWDAVTQEIDLFVDNEITKGALLKKLSAAIDRKSPFSAVAICCIKSRKSNIPADIYNQLDLNL